MNKETPENELDTNEADSSKPRRKFLKQAALSATGAITFVKVSSGASEGSLPAIVSLLLEDDVLAPELGVSLTIDPIEGEEVQQVIRAPIGAQFVQVQAQGAGGGGAAVGPGRDFSEGASGGDGGQVSALLELDGLGSTLTAQVGTGGGASGDVFGQGGQFGGGNGGDISGAFEFSNNGVKGAGGGGHASLLDAQNRVVLLAGKSTP